MNLPRENIEIVFLHVPRALSAWKGDARRDLSVTVRQGEISELLVADKLPRNSATVFVVDEAQYAEWKLIGNVEALFDVLNPWGVVVLHTRKKNVSEFEAQVLRFQSVLSCFNSDLAKADLAERVFQAAQSLLIRLRSNQLDLMQRSRSREANAINAIGLAMAGGQNLDDLLKLVLEKTMEVSSADCGFLLYREHLISKPEGEEDAVKLQRRISARYTQKARIVKSQNIRLHSDMLDPNKSEFIARVANRGCGVSWFEGQSSPSFWRESFVYPEALWPLPKCEVPEGSTYAVQSYCVFPIKTPSEEVVGLVLLLNRRRSNSLILNSEQDVGAHVTEFSDHDLTLIEALISQAGVAIDHTRLYKDLKTVFESFVQASVTAIESRDPSTKGHSIRVANMTVGFAEALNRMYSGSYGNIFFTPSQLYEIRYASLLHDFGKIGVREDVLRKGNKLHRHEMTIIRERFDIIENKLRVRCLEKYLDILMSKGEPPDPQELARIDREVTDVATQLHELWGSIQTANEPQIVQNANMQKFVDLAALKMLIGDTHMELMTEDELSKLSIKKGSLSQEERAEIESHVTHSYRFLIQIPWTSELANIPDIVYAHHERLDGSGYPLQLVSDEIPVQARLMAITDIYDALVAMDRPYKKAVSHERALDILEAEVKEGKLDRELFDIFVEARIGDIIKDTKRVA